MEDNPIRDWRSVEATIPKNMPDNVYNMIKENYYHSKVAPWLTQNRMSVSLSYEQFMSMAREGAVKNPRTEVAIASAINTAAEPIQGLLGMGKKEKAESIPAKALEQTKMIAERQGVNTLVPEMLGSALGYAPYIIPAARTIGMASVGQRVAVGAVTQAAIDGMKEADGDRLTAAAQGFVIGGLFEAAGEGVVKSVGAISNRLMSKGASAQTANALDAAFTDSKMLNPEEMAKISTIFEDFSTKFPDDLEAINREAIEALQESAEVARKMGIPKSPPVVSSNSAVAQITLNGKTAAVPLDGANFGLLAQGASIDGFSGTINQIDTAIRRIEQEAIKANTLQVPLTGSTPLGAIPTVTPVLDFPMPKAKADIGNVSKFMTEMRNGDPITYRTLEQKFGLDMAQSDVLLDTLRQRGQLQDIGNGVHIYKAMLPDEGARQFTDALRSQIMELPTLTPRAIAQRFGVTESQASRGLQNLQEEGFLRSTAESVWEFDPNKTPELMRKLLLKTDNSTLEVVDRMIQVAKDPTEPPSTRGQAMMWLKEHDQNAFDTVAKGSTDQWLPKDVSPSDLLKFGKNAFNRADQTASEMYVAGETGFINSITGNNYSNMADAMTDTLMWQKYGRMSVEDIKTIAGQLHEKGATSAAEFYDRLAAWRNGERPFPPPSMFKDTPTGQWINDIEGVLSKSGAQSASATTGVGETPMIQYDLTKMNRETIWHETMHSIFSYFGLDDVLKKSDWGQKALAFGNFDKDTFKFYRDWWGKDFVQRWPQEYTVRAFTAFRQNDIFTINQMAKAFKLTPEEFRQSTVEMAQNLREYTVGESAMARIAQRKLDSLATFSERSVATLSDMKLRSKGMKAWYEKGMFAVYDSTTKTKRYFKDRELLNEFLTGHEMPVNAPVLVDDSILTNTIKWQPMAKSVGVTPPEMGPPAAEPSLLGLKEPIQAGVSTGSFFFRPFTDWIRTFSTKHGIPMLADQMTKLQRLEQARNFEIERFRKPLHDTLKKYGHQRLRDFNSYLEAKGDPERQIAAKMLNLTQKEIDDLTKIRKEVLEPLKDTYGYDVEAYIQNWRGKLVQKLNDPDFVSPEFPDELLYAEKTLQAPSEEKFFTGMIRSGYANPATENAAHIIESFINYASKRKWLGEDLNLAKKMINEKTESGEYVLGTARPLLVNHLNYMKGQPDMTSKMVNSAVNNVLTVYREIAGQINAKLPEFAKLEKIPVVRALVPDEETTAQDVIAKWLTYSYAGGLAFRPAVIIRDPIVYFLTTMPILGMRKSLGAMAGMVTKWKDPAFYEEALKRGMIMSARDVEQVASGQEVTLTNRLVDKSLSALQWGNNAVRLTAFKGFAETIEEALQKGVTADFLSESRLIFLDKSRRQELLKGAQQAYNAGGEIRKQWVYDQAAEMVKLTNWDYMRGNAPGLYKYTLGRIFGQYGTWPMNYVEYMRKISGAGNEIPAKDRLMAMGRLMAIHTAVLNTAEVVGVDASSWVFHNPAQWTGGPALNAMLNVPMLGNFDDARGDEARREVGRLIFPMSVPGGLAAKNVWKAIQDEDARSWQKLLGFVPVEDKDLEHGTHKAMGGWLR